MLTSPLAGKTIHPTADVQSRRIGAGTSVWQFSVILPGARIGGNYNINCHYFVENDVVIGNNVTVKSGMHLLVVIGSNATFVHDLYPRSKQYPEDFVKTVARKGALMGAGATIPGGIETGAGALIGLGGVITKNAPANTEWYGHSAKNMGPV